MIKSLFLVFNFFFVCKRFERSEVKSRANIERFERLCISACEQSKRVRVMKTGIGDKEKILEEKEGFFGDVMNDDFDGDENRVGKLIVEEINGRKYLRKEICLLIGPEGGFTEEEKEEFQKKGFLATSFNDGILRVETAAIVGIAMLKNTFT